MQRIEPIDWNALNAKVATVEFKEAVKIVCRELTITINELVEAYNEQQN